MPTRYMDAREVGFYQVLPDGTLDNVSARLKMGYVAPDYSRTFNRSMEVGPGDTFYCANVIGDRYWSGYRGTFHLQKEEAFEAADRNDVSYIVDARTAATIENPDFVYEDDEEYEDEYDEEGECDDPDCDCNN